MIPKFSLVDFLSFYVEIPVMTGMSLAWLFLRRRRSRIVKFSSQDDDLSSAPLLNPRPGADNTLAHRRPTATWWESDLVDVKTVDLTRDEYEEEEEVDRVDEDLQKGRLTGRLRWAWNLYYWLV